MGTWLVSAILLLALVSLYHILPLREDYSGVPDKPFIDILLMAIIPLSSFFAANVYVGRFYRTATLIDCIKSIVILFIVVTAFYMAAMLWLFNGFQHSLYLYMLSTGKLAATISISAALCFAAMSWIILKCKRKRGDF